MSIEQRLVVKILGKLSSKDLSTLGIDLANPPRISITRHSDKDVRVNIPESEPVQACLIVRRHDLLLGTFRSLRDRRVSYTGAFRGPTRLNDTLYGLTCRQLSYAQIVCGLQVDPRLSICAEIPRQA